MSRHFVSIIRYLLIQTFIANTPYTISAPNDPTYFPTDINIFPDILDILLIKSIPFVCMQETLAELDPEHLPVKNHN